MPATAPTTEIGYVQAPTYNWWLYDNETTPELIWPQSIYVFDQMRRTDAQVGSVLRAVTETLLRTPWRIDPAGARARVVKFVADDLGLPIMGKKPMSPPRLKDRFSWSAHLREALLMLPYGHSYFEQVYRVDDSGNAAHLRKLAYRPAKTIERIDVAPDGGLIAIKQYWTATNTEPKPIPVDRLVAYIHAKEGGNWLGTSILRNCYKNWLIKDRLLRVQAQTIERNGMGVPLYKGQEGASPDDMTKGLNMATAWRAGEAAGSAVPFGADLVLRGVEGDLPDAQPAIDYHDSQIARAVLAHFLNLGTQTGSWALGTTFADFFTMSLQTLAEQIRDTATSHIVEDLVDINFGESEPAPRLVFDEIGSRQAATAQALKMLVDAGVIHPDQVLEESSRQQYGLPPADPATATTPPTPSGQAPQAPTQTGDMSVAAAAMGDPKGVAAELADPDEEADDREDAIDALIQALAELDGYVEAAFDPTKHPRNPKGSPGGGRFRSMVDRLKDAITEHQKGKGADHPFDGFDREQLRRVAKARGIELKRGEDRDSIAHKLLDHLGGAKPGKSTTPKPKAKATPRPRKPPAPLTPAQELERWRADAAKPGRVRDAHPTGPTKRQEYVASWERHIANTKKEIADAKANGLRHRLSDLEKTLKYQTDARDAVRDRPDPSLDEPASGFTHKLARKVDQKRPLAVYGDMLHMDGTDDAWTHQNMTELERVPADLHGVVAAHMAVRDTGGIWLDETGVSGMDHSHDLAGGTPRGWGDGKTFDDVNGVYRPAQRVMLVGRTANSDHRGDNTATHEFGHALDAALGGPSKEGDWGDLHEKALAQPHLSPYYRQAGHAGVEEFWAEAFSAWVTARQRRPGFDTRATYIVRLNVSAALGDEIHDYFTQLAAKGVG